MTRHTAEIAWRRDGAEFLDSRYSRKHTWRVDGGIEIRASASPHVVPVPLSDPHAIDPEEAFVAALASCHMLWFLALAAKKGHVVDSYVDEAVGEVGPDAAGGVGITRITLRPRVAFASSSRPDPAEHRALHHQAHDLCFLARAVRAPIDCEPVDVTPAA